MSILKASLISKHYKTSHNAAEASYFFAIVPPKALPEVGCAGLASLRSILEMHDRGLTWLHRV